MSAEDRVLDAFRSQYRQNQADLEAFDAAVRAEAFTNPHEAVAWCRQWWEERLQGRALEHGERRLRGTQGRN